MAYCRLGGDCDLYCYSSRYDDGREFYFLRVAHRAAPAVEDITDDYYEHGIDALAARLEFLRARGVRFPDTLLDEARADLEVD
jgi:hypothetical protein